MKLARVVFWAAGVWGVLVLVPLYFLMGEVGRQDPPGVTHPEFYYGFLGVGLAWQVAFLIIAIDPQRFRPIIPAAILEKLTYVVACAVLLALGRIPMVVAFGGVGDLILGTLFTICYFRLKPAAETTR